MPAVTAVGIDACKSGWIAVAMRLQGDAEAHYLASIDDLAGAIPDVSLVAIDIPIGLPAAGRRQADAAARAFLGARRNSVFFAPVREALLAPTHAEATAVSLRLAGAGISQQAYRLAAKIFEVECWLPRAGCPVFEVHPEVSFAEMLGAPASATKKSWAGMIERRAILAETGIALENSSGAASTRAAVDDMLDAGAAAWSAMRLLRDTARSLPAPPELDSHGRQVAIWV
jgi:predicted RNase H-like nuclease